MSEVKYKKAAQTIIKAGILPFPLTDTLMEILKYLLDEDDLDFIIAFRRKLSQTMVQLKKSSKLPEEEILKKIEKLAKKGLIFNQPSSKGVMVYRLLPLIFRNGGPFRIRNGGVFRIHIHEKNQIHGRREKTGCIIQKIV